MLNRHLHQLLEGDSRAARMLAYGIVALILLNVLAMILESVPGWQPDMEHGFVLFEMVSVLVFSAEYVLRLLACTADPRYHRPILGRLRYALTPFALIDLFAVLPWYLPGNIVDLRVLRAMRMLRMVKIGRYSGAAKGLARVVRAKRFELTSMAAILVLLLIVASTVMYNFEHEAQPERFSSIPAAMWWAVVTLTTVGYGDLAPVTTGGRIVASFVAVLGIGMFAVPAGILASGYSEDVARRRREHETRTGHPHACPQCGRPFEQQ